MRLPRMRAKYRSRAGDSNIQKLAVTQSRQMKSNQTPKLSKTWPKLFRNTNGKYIRILSAEIGPINVQTNQNSRIPEKGHTKLWKVWAKIEKSPKLSKKNNSFVSKPKKPFIPINLIKNRQCFGKIRRYSQKAHICMNEKTAKTRASASFSLPPAEESRSSRGELGLGLFRGLSSVLFPNPSVRIPVSQCGRQWRRRQATGEIAPARAKKRAKME